MNLNHYDPRTCADPKILEALAQSADPWARCEVAMNSATPAHVQAQLARDPQVGPDTVALNSGADPAVLAELATDARPRVREYVAQNRNCLPATLLLLAADPVPRVRAGVASNAAAPLTAQALLARDPDVTVRRYMAYNAYATPEVFAVLAQDVRDVRVCVSANFSAPENVLLSLLEDPDVTVRNQAQDRLTNRKLAALGTSPAFWITN